MDARARLLAELIGAILDILGEKEVFTEEEYAKVKASMSYNSSPYDTFKALEDILSDLREKK